MRVGKSWPEELWRTEAGPDSWPLPALLSLLGPTGLGTNCQRAGLASAPPARLTLCLCLTPASGPLCPLQETFSTTFGTKL